MISENQYIAGLMVISYENEMEAAFLDRILSLEINLQFSIFYEKQQSSEMIKRLTYYIGNTGAEIKNTNDNQKDADLMEVSYHDAKYIRKQLQVGGDDMYYLYMFICVYADSAEKLKQDIERISRSSK